MKNLYSKIFFLILSIASLFFSLKINAQTCSGSFGNPIFNENFGTVNTPVQTISPALVAPAYTSYQYASIYPPNDGQYTIINQSGFAAWDFINSSDHSNNPPGTYGNMLVVNASYTPGEFYRRRVSNLCSNQFYKFSAWILNLHGGENLIKPNVTFQIRTTSGAIIGSVSTGDIPEDRTWKNFSIDFKSDINSNAVDVVLINNSAGGIGNDLAIDDISFSPCGPSTNISADIPSVFSTGVCDNSQGFQLEANLSANTFLNVNYIWQKSSDGGKNWQDLTYPTSNPKVSVAPKSYQNGDQFRFIVGESANILSLNCQVISAPISIKINGFPAAPGVNNPIKFCQNSVPNALTATGTNLLWYTSATGGSGSSSAPVPNTATLGTTSYWVSQTSATGCEGPRTEVKVNIIPNPSAPIVVSSVDYCQNYNATPLSATGTNLLWYTSATGGSGSSSAPIPDTSIAGTFSFFVTQNNGNCESPRAEIKVKISPEPHSASLIDTTICDGQTITLDAGSGFKNYEWNTTPPTFSQTLQVSKIGTYSVILTDFKGCSASQNVNVTAGETPKIVNIISTENSIEIIASGGNPPYSYSIDNQKTWQSSNIFTNLKAGVYTVFVKSQLNSCSISVETAVIFIPNVITPNDDSFNDVFKIKNIEYYPNSKILIFNQFGEIIFQSSDTKNFSWDGRYLGRILPTGTYYYILELGNDYKKTGWILLKNRN